MFQIGDRVVYPMHGAGIVEGTEEKTVGGRSVTYYRIQIMGGHIQLLLPVENSGNIRLRPMIGPEQARAVLDYFRTLEIDMSVPWGRRHRENTELLKTGEPENEAAVLKALMLRERTVGLSTGDRQTMVLAKNILSSELALTLGVTMEQIQQELRSAADEAAG